MTHTKTAARTKLHLHYVPRSEDFQVYLDDNTSINGVPVEKISLLGISMTYLIYFKNDDCACQKSFASAQMGFRSKQFWLVSLSGIMQHKFKKKGG